MGSGMTLTNSPIETYWRRFLSSLPDDSPYHGRRRTEDGWGDGPDMADELGGLIARGTKTATCSSLWEWEAEGGPLPQVGDLTMVLDGRGAPKCIIETIEVCVRKFCEVDGNFAWAEGEGDRSLSYWREAHKSFFSRALPKIGMTFSVDMLLVCERFRIVHGP
jgi:uncharacterized protein YhfF